MKSRTRFTAMACVAVVVVAAVVHAQTYTVLYNFGSKSGDPLDPGYQGIIAQGRDGNLYSTTSNGGTTFSGDVFRITPTGSLAGIHNFDGTMECLPLSGLTLGRDGNFYGTTEGCGTSMLGTVFKITPSGTFTVLHNFTNTGDGGIPNAPPIQGTDGNFYGTTHGSLTGGGLGTVYRLTPSGTFTTLFQFDGTHGEFPAAPLVQGRDGNFYGTTEEGGSNGAGAVFKITPAGKLTVLHNFNTTNGADPIGPLIQASDGNFYGTTEKGGTQGSGVVFKITAGGAFTILHNFNSITDGGSPFAGLVQATDGNFYGSAASGGSDEFGTIYRISSTGSFTVLHNFDNTTGASPSVTLVQHTNGILYGAAFVGGTRGQGTFFSLNVGLHPFVSLLSTSGKAGQVVEILGNGLTGTTSVKFGTGSASFNIISDTYMTAVVPVTGTTGPVTVTTPSGIRVSNKKFRVIPVISSFSPTSGTIGAQVVIAGSGLKQTTKVTFGDVTASFVVNSATQVSATVPGGAVTGKIA
ncbi:MAG TPA: choice-of-anchor tandem repeat GloVer-containing protein, partial [Terriglobales bacterium]|nr:choice-of-anchor tandem repeat GloVer-containing protein [Terriglobales bacterium]